MAAGTRAIGMWGTIARSFDLALAHRRRWCTRREYPVYASVSGRHWHRTRLKHLPSYANVTGVTSSRY